MQKLINELTRLYLPHGFVATEAFQQQFLGQGAVTVQPIGPGVPVRAITMPFDRQEGDDHAEHWTRLCTVANALQGELGLPAPAVSVSGDKGYVLWMSLETPVPAAQAQGFAGLVRRAYFPEAGIASDATGAALALPPHLDPRTGKWAAFIHPGLGASFADDCGLEMPPPLAGQAGFLESVQSASAQQFMHALDRLRHAHEPAGVAAAPVAAAPALDSALLLKDATLEDIIAFLHAKNIEPTFRHLIPQSRRGAND